MERDICPIAVLCLTVIRSFSNIYKRWSTRVQFLPHRYIATILGHVMSLVD